MSDARPRTRAGNKDSKAVKPYDRRRAGTFSRISTSRKVHDGSSNDASNDNNGMDSDSDNSSCAALGPSGFPWNGGIWPHDFLAIMEESATLSVTTGGCYYLDTPDGRKSIPAHLLLPEVYEQYGIGDNNWIILPEQEGEWTPQSELRRLEEGLCTKLYQDDIFMSLPDREGCMCPEWMLETGIWDAPPQYRAL
ncbi:hypothetical protein ID866_7747 [Astraeus odoratus]|nr:hypothetical protein ID866_7747 [Astraeus odoratus]